MICLIDRLVSVLPVELPGHVLVARAGLSPAPNAYDMALLCFLSYLAMNGAREKICTSISGHDREIYNQRVRIVTTPA